MRPFFRGSRSIASARVLASRTLVLGLLAASCATQAQSVGEQFEIITQTLDSGGASVGTEYAINGTVGQPDVTTQMLVGAEFQVSGGFWPRDIAPAPNGDAIFLDGFEAP